MSLPVLLEVPDLIEAKLYKTRQAVYNAVHAGRLPFPAIRHGKRLLFLESDVVNYIVAQAGRPASGGEA